MQMQKLRTPLLRTQSSKVLPVNHGVGQNIALHASLTARDFFLSKFFLQTKSSPQVLAVLAVSNAGSYVCLQTQIDHLLIITDDWCWFWYRVSVEYK